MVHTTNLSARCVYGHNTVHISWFSYEREYRNDGECIEVLNKTENTIEEELLDTNKYPKMFDIIQIELDLLLQLTALQVFSQCPQPEK